MQNTLHQEPCSVCLVLVGQYYLLISHNTQCYELTMGHINFDQIPKCHPNKTRRDPIQHVLFSSYIHLFSYHLHMNQQAWHGCFYQTREQEGTWLPNNSSLTFSPSCSCLSSNLLVSIQQMDLSLNNWLQTLKMHSIYTCVEHSDLPPLDHWVIQT